MLKKNSRLTSDYLSICKEHGVIVKRSSELSNLTYARLGGKADFCCYPASSESFTKIVREFQENKLPFRVVGNTTNILFLDSVDYACLVFTNLLNEINFCEDCVSVLAGRPVIDFCRDLAMRGFSGAEGLEGIPGTIGGALTMNAGAYGYTISDYLVSVKIIEPTGEIREITKKNLVFSNRSAPSLINKFILSAEFQFPRGDHQHIEKKMRRYHISRHQYQEWVYPNLGSIFVVPGLNIHMNVLREMGYRKPITAFFVRFILTIWSLKPIFFIRRSFPEFNLPQRLIGYFCGGAYDSILASKCTINTFVNKNATSYDLLKYISSVKNNAGPMVIIENEIITDTISKINNKKQFDNELEIIDGLHNEK